MRPRTWILAAAAVLVTVTGGVLVTSGARPPAVAAWQPSANTATVERRTLSAMVSQGGILTYRARPDGSPYAVINHAGGTYTELPTAGEVIAQGHVLYRVSDHPVVLLTGSTPAYRTLAAGTNGPDVAELNADLVALGYATRGQIMPRSAFFGAATTAAVEKLQAATGAAQSGRLTLGQAEFEPTAMRVTGVSAQLGSGAQPGGAVMQGTSTIRQVQVALDPSQETSLAVGDKVSITMPDNVTTSGRVSSVGPVATCPSSSGSGATGSSSTAQQADTCAAGGSQSSAPTITVDVAPSHPAAAGTWDQAPVQVGITTASVRGAVVVPVTALLARAGGGYAVEVVGPGAGARTHLVPVSLGMFNDAQGLVQVTSSTLAAGQAVVVPGS